MRDFFNWHPLGQIITVVFYLSILYLILYIGENSPAIFLR